MLTPYLNEISTVESPTQSPKKIQKLNNILPQNMNLFLQKLKTEKKNYFSNIISVDKKDKDENNKLGEMSLKERRTTIVGNVKKSDKNGILLDFDFLVGEFLDKIILRNNFSSFKDTKKKKVEIRKRMRFTKIKNLNYNLNKKQKSKLH